MSHFFFVTQLSQIHVTNTSFDAVQIVTKPLSQTPTSRGLTHCKASTPWYGLIVTLNDWQQVPAAPQAPSLTCKLLSAALQCDCVMSANKSVQTYSPASYFSNVTFFLHTHAYTPPWQHSHAVFRFTPSLITSCPCRFKEHPSSSEKWSRKGGMKNEADRCSLQLVTHFDDAEDASESSQKFQKEKCVDVRFWWKCQTVQNRIRHIYFSIY